ncbi:MAG: AAA family ATPase [bacterium]
MLIRGARQVGKTWIVRQLGQRFDQFVEINFELYPQVKKIFHRDLDPNRITRDLSLFIGKKIIPGNRYFFSMQFSARLWIPIGRISRNTPENFK